MLYHIDTQTALNVSPTIITQGADGKWPNTLITMPAQDQIIGVGYGILDFTQSDGATTWQVELQYNLVPSNSSFAICRDSVVNIAAQTIKQIAFLNNLGGAALGGLCILVPNRVVYTRTAGAGTLTAKIYFGLGDIS